MCHFFKSYRIIRNASARVSLVLSDFYLQKKIYRLLSENYCRLHERDARVSGYLYMTCTIKMVLIL